jgi:hypothetical protein
MNKSEQKVLATIQAANDAGNGCNNPVGRTKGAKNSWRRGGGYSGGVPIVAEEKALAKLLASGVVIQWMSGYYVADHPVLREVAASIDLMRIARRCEEVRVDLERQEEILMKCREFVIKYSV